MSRENITVVGAQWGDEGKGKLVDFFAQKADVVVRWAGGDNAGHSIKFGGKEYKLSIIPSGIFNPKTINVISPGCVVNLDKINSEILYIKDNGFNTNNLRISDKATVILPYHMQIDALEEEKRKADKIGTTKKGIGPAYQDSIGRKSIRLCDFQDLKELESKLKIIHNEKEEYIKNTFNEVTFSYDEVLSNIIEKYNLIKEYVCDTSSLVYNAIKENKKVLFEGAQGVLLDIFYGTYPFVTSSHPSASSIPINVGIPAQMLKTVIGVVKAYNTRVGTGPFPSEFDNDISIKIRETGREYGTVTGRARRIGWLDIPALKYAIMISGITDIAITLIDVLDDLDEIMVCESYKINDKEIDYIPSSLKEYYDVKPALKSFKGWKKDITKIKKYEELPEELKRYVEYIEEQTQVKVSIISVGPQREQTILRRNFFNE